MKLTTELIIAIICKYTCDFGKKWTKVGGGCLTVYFKDRIYTVTFEVTPKLS